MSDGDLVLVGLGFVLGVTGNLNINQITRAPRCRVLETRVPNVDLDPTLQGYDWGECNEQ